RTFRKIFRLIIGLWIFFGPLLYYSLFGQINPLKSEPKTPSMQVLHALYIGTSYGFACIGLPVVTIARLLRKPPRQLLEEKTEVLDLKAVLGHTPVGDGKWKSLAKLPGNMFFTVDFTTLTIGFKYIPPESD